MLLRRVIEHVKAQNWTAVALDFVIVVIGVFIGIQVANRDAARQSRVLRRFALSLAWRAHAAHPILCDELSITNEEVTP